MEDRMKRGERWQQICENFKLEPVLCRFCRSTTQDDICVPRVADSVLESSSAFHHRAVWTDPPSNLQDTLYGAGVKVPKHIKRQPKVSQVSEVVETLTGLFHHGVDVTGP
ncbi:hypothetical protein QTP86_007089 [Hemibagrus guttatus]|nr:hypothetical protein QTP86_007089 [Hemibagrus guttatus]